MCKLKSTLLFAGIVAIAGASCHRLEAQTQAQTRLDRTALIPTFEENFAREPTYYDPFQAPTGRWKTNYAFGPQDPRSPNAWVARTHVASNEMQYYGDPTRGTNPFIWKPGSLTIVGRPNPYLANPATHGKPYLSGLLTTEKSFEQTYGYFEIRAAMNIGQGLWPAFWLLPHQETLPDPTMRQLPDEVDVFENVGKDHEIYATVHSNVNGLRDGTRYSDGERITMGSLTVPHDYGVMITSQDIRWFIDSVEVRRRPNLTFHRPAYMLIDLAIGGKWPGPPNATTPFPARMIVYSVRAYKFRTTMGAASARSGRRSDQVKGG